MTAAFSKKLEVLLRHSTTGELNINSTKSQNGKKRVPCPKQPGYRLGLTCRVDKSEFYLNRALLSMKTSHTSFQMILQCCVHLAQKVCD